jgi:CubicO group peptidase (beta-lactamase class C family)
LPREAAFPYWTGPEYNFPTREQMIEKLSSQEEFYAADDYYQYSNLGMSLLGEVVAAASGQPYADYIKQRILSPLLLKDTTPEMPENQKGGRLATSYSMRLRDGSRKAIPFFQVKGIAPAAGFASTVEDLGRFASWQFRLIEKGGSEVLAANTLKEMHRVHYLDSNWQTARGLGYSVANRNDKVIVGHNGTCPGFRTQLDMWMKDKIGITIMGNSNDVNPGSYTRGIYDVIAPAIEGAIKSPEKAQKPDPTLEKYVGTYEQPFGGETHVLIVEGSFLRTFSVPTDNPAGRITKLKRVEGDVFQAVSEDGRPTPKVIFETGPDGKVTRMVRDSNYSVKIN